MAGIDKIYATVKEAAEFFDWVENQGDKRFKEEFKEAGNISLKNYMYISSPETLKEITDPDQSFPLTNFPEMVDVWLFKQKDLPKFARDRLCYQHGLKTAQDEEEFLKRELEEIDPRPIGNHAKIIKRTGVLEHSNYFLKAWMEIDGNFYRYMWLNRRYPEESAYERYLHMYEFLEQSSLKDTVDDYWWYCEESDDWESATYPKKKNIGSSYSSYQHFWKTSLKAIIRKLLKKYKFPIGTVIRLTELNCDGEVYLKITK